MMHAYLRPLLLAAVCLFLVACDSNQDDVDLARGAMTARLNGTVWEAVNATANRLTAGGATTITIAGATISGEAVSFSLTDTGAGEYALDDTFNPAGPDVLSASYTKAPGQTYLGTAGNVTVSSADDDGMAGTFSFETRNQAGEIVSVTDGSFNVGFGVSIGG